MKILVSGGLGYIGSHTVVELINSGYEPIIVDNAYNSYTSTISDIENVTGKKVIYYEIDLCDKNKVEEIFQIQNFDGVIHFAALKAVGESMEIPLKYFRNNLECLMNVLYSSQNNGVKAFIFSSSCTVYGDVKTSPVYEDTPMMEASSVYGRTKQMAEQMINDISSVVNYKSILLRYFNPAGAHLSALLGENSKNPALNLVPVITETALGLREEMHVFGDDYDTRDGSCIRDYIHVVDLANAHVKAFEYAMTNIGKKVDIFNLGIGQGVSVLEAIRAFEKQVGRKVNYKIHPRRPGDVEAIYCDNNKAKNILGWKPKYNIDDIMLSSFNYLKRKKSL
jgi:UDP-glucose 4-epimerase